MYSDQSSHHEGILEHVSSLRELLEHSRYVHTIVYSAVRLTLELEADALDGRGEGPGVAESGCAVVCDLES